jgi:hypothetical protein
MKHIQFKHLLTATAAMMALHLPGAALAQYVWIDEKGTKQFSDMPPPSSVPASRILKQPGIRTTPSATTPESAGLPENPPAAAKTELSTAEKNAEYRKRKTEQAEKEKKAAEESKLAADRAKNCERARDYQRTLETGERISRTDKNGERSFLTDEQRAQEVRDARRVLEDCKS